MDLHKSASEGKPRQDLPHDQWVRRTGIPGPATGVANVREPEVGTLAPEKECAAPKRHPGARRNGGAANGHGPAAEEIQEGQKKRQKRDGAPEEDQAAGGMVQ